MVKVASTLFRLNHPISTREWIVPVEMGVGNFMKGNHWTAVVTEDLSQVTAMTLKLSFASTVLQKWQ